MTISSGDPQVYQPGFLPFKPERSFYFRGGLLVRVSSLHDLSSMGNRRASHVVGSALRFHLSIPQPSSDRCCLSSSFFSWHVPLVPSRLHRIVGAKHTSVFFQIVKVTKLLRSIFYQSRIYSEVRFLGSAHFFRMILNPKRAASALGS